MAVFEFNRKHLSDEGDYPMRGYQLKIDLNVDFGDTPMPTRAERRWALHVLQQELAALEETDLTLVGHRDPAPVALPRDTLPKPEPRKEPEMKWEKPDDLDLRIIKSAHRIVAEVAKRGIRGRIVLASELVGAIGLSAPTVGRLLREGDPGYDYLKRYLRITPEGRTKALDLTADGHKLASLIRADAVPA